MILQMKISEICDKTDLNMDQLQMYMDFIKQLNPSPGLVYSKAHSTVIQPSLRIDIIDGVLKLTNYEQERIMLTLNPEMVAKLKKNRQMSCNKNLMKLINGWTILLSDKI